MLLQQEHGRASKSLAGASGRMMPRCIPTPGRAPCSLWPLPCSTVSDRHPHQRGRLTHPVHHYGIHSGPGCPGPSWPLFILPWPRHLGSQPCSSSRMWGLPWRMWWWMPWSQRVPIRTGKGLPKHWRAPMCTSQGLPKRWRARLGHLCLLYWRRGTSEDRCRLERHNANMPM